MGLEKPEGPNHDAEYHWRIRQKAEEDKAKAHRERYEAAQDARIAKLVALLERVAKQIDRYTDEQSPENRSKPRREWLEIVGLWAAAAVGVAAIIVGSSDAGRQIGEIKSTRHDNKDFVTQQLQVLRDQTAANKQAADAAKASADANTGQLTEMRQAGRAWVGSPVAVAETVATRDADVKITISYQNMGREPARRFNDNALGQEPVPIFNVALLSGELNDTLTASATACLGIAFADGGQIVYPNTGGASGAAYSLHVLISKDLITDDVIKGETSILVRGCFTYVTAQKVRHSAFCYTWNAKVNDATHLSLSFCPTGNDGD